MTFVRHCHQGREQLIQVMTPQQPAKTLGLQLEICLNFLKTISSVLRSDNDPELRRPWQAVTGFQGAVYRPQTLSPDER